METQQVTVDVPKATYALEEGLKKFLADVMAVLADGWQPFSDVPALLTASLSDLVPVAGDVAKVLPELQADPEAMARLAGLTIGELVAPLVKKVVGG